MVGAFVVDTRDDRLARVCAVRNRRLYLRPPGYDPYDEDDEWEAMPEHVRDVDAAEDLRARVAVENARSVYWRGA